MTPAGVCKESGCGGQEPQGGGRTNNVPICPIPSANDNAYVTLGGGGLFVLKIGETILGFEAERFLPTLSTFSHSNSTYWSFYLLCTHVFLCMSSRCNTHEDCW